MKYKILLRLTIVYGIFTSACYDDKSNLDLNKIPDVVIDTTGIESLIRVVQFDSLKLNPKVTKNGSSNGLTYKWLISDMPFTDAMHWINIGNDMHLKTVIKLSPGIKPYLLWFIVRDTALRVEYSHKWNLEISSEFDEGLVIADSKDGKNSDLSLWMAPEITGGFKGKDRLKRHIYSTANDKLLPGIVKEMSYTVRFKEKELYAITPKSIYKINPLDFHLSGENTDLFFAPPSNFNFQYLGNGRQVFMLILNHKLIISSHSTNFKFGLPLNGDYEIDDYIAKEHRYNGEDINPDAIFYDRKNGKFWYTENIWATTGSLMVMKPLENVDEEAADPTNQPNLKCLAADIVDNCEYCFLMKHKTTSKISIYRFCKNVFTNYVQTRKAHITTVYEIPEHIAGSNAVGYAFSENQRIMFWATETEIYAGIMTGEKILFSRKYTAPAGETITGIKMFKQSWWLYDSTSQLPELPQNNNQLIITTWNGSEGKVHLLPLINIGSGDIDLAHIKTEGGFGKISCVQSIGK